MSGIDCYSEICVHICTMSKINIKTNGVWADEKTAAQYYKIKPATLRKHRSDFGHDKGLEWKKVRGRVLYNLEHNDQVLEESNEI